MEDSSSAYKARNLASISLGSSLWSCCFRYSSASLTLCSYINLKTRASNIPLINSDENVDFAGNFHWNFEDVAKSIVCMLMSGPFLTGYTQVLFLDVYFGFILIQQNICIWIASLVNYYYYFFNPDN